MIKQIDFSPKKWYSFVTEYTFRSVNRIKKIHDGPKRYFDRRSQRLANQRKKNKPMSVVTSVYGDFPRKRTRTNRTESILQAPKDFSIMNNPEATIRYFSNIRIKAKEHFDKSIFLDISNVETITIDAIMYILATVFNLKGANVRRVRFAGNAPKNEAARAIFTESGFYQFVNSSSKHITSNSKKIKILTGKSIESKSAGSICDFFKQELNDKTLVKSLYPIIIELMDNTIQHAYQNDNQFAPFTRQWYVFVENVEDRINMTFLDTGLGIPFTVNKKFREKILSTFTNYKDAVLIFSALKGEFRTRTKQQNRGKGLQNIYESFLNNQINALTIVSGGGIVSFENKEPKLITLNHELAGTIITWSVNKRPALLEGTIE